MDFKLRNRNPVNNSQDTTRLADATICIQNTSATIKIATMIVDKNHTMRAKNIRPKDERAGELRARIENSLGKLGLYFAKLSFVTVAK